MDGSLAIFDCTLGSKGKTLRKRQGLENILFCFLGQGICSMLSNFFWEGPQIEINQIRNTFLTSCFAPFFVLFWICPVRLDMEVPVFIFCTVSLLSLNWCHPEFRCDWSLSCLLRPEGSALFQMCLVFVLCFNFKY